MAKPKLSIKGDLPVSKKALTDAAQHAPAQPEDLPEAKATPAAKKAAAKKVFKDADAAIGLEPEQATLQRAVFGY